MMLVEGRLLDELERHHATPFIFLGRSNDLMAWQGLYEGEPRG